MAQLSGTAGSVVAGTVTVGEISEWSLNLSASTVDVTAFGDNWIEKIVSVRDASGSFSGNMDLADTAQGTLINSMLGGSAVALKLYASATKYWNVGTAFVTGMGPAISQTGKGEISFDFETSGPVTLV